MLLKNSGEIMISEKVYHIYAKDRCLYHSLKEEDFQKVWDNLKGMIGLMKTDYCLDDLSFVELPPMTGGNGSASSEPPGSPSF